MAKAEKVKKVLFFIADVAATEAEKEAASQFEGSKFTLCFRNASKIGFDDPIEAFDIVAGDVPVQYQVAADEKGEDLPGPTPIVPAASVPAASPLAPPVAAEGAKDDAKPVKPAPPAPDPAKGWKPNA